MRISAANREGFAKLSIVGFGIALTNIGKTPVTNVRAETAVEVPDAIKSFTLSYDPVSGTITGKIVYPGRDFPLDGIWYGAPGPTTPNPIHHAATLGSAFERSEVRDRVRKGHL